MTRSEEIEKGVEYFRKNKKRLASLYKEMYGEALCLTCPGSIEMAYEYILKNKDKKVSLYKMKRGCVINTYMVDDVELPKGHFTIHNMTDELAELLIKKGYSSYFIL